MSASALRFERPPREVRNPSEVATALAHRKVDEILLEMDGPITLDGEIYHASREEGAVRVSTGGWPSFLQV